MMMAKHVTIPYVPRPLWKKEIHPGLESHRFSVLVCHRRFGKTVGVVNHLIKQALRCRRRAPQYAYIAPFQRQAILVAWAYIKFYTAPIPGVKVNNSSYYVELPSIYPDSPGARIYVMGADNPDALRGMYLDGVILDEYGQIKENLWGEIIRPALADRKGWAVFVGTPKGQNGFFQKYQEALGHSDWYHCLYKASETGVIDKEELASMRDSMSDVEFQQEMECDFTVAAFDALLGGDDIQRAVDRIYNETHLGGSVNVMGVDIARFGGDKSCIVMRRGLSVMPPARFAGLDTMTLAGTVIGYINRFKPDAVFIDSGAMGAGVIDRVRQLGYSVIEVAFGGKANDDSRYFNKRTEMYARCADYIKKDGGAIPDDAELREELANVYYGFDPRGRMKLKSKDEIKEMLGRSPDTADALALTFAQPVARRQDYGLGNPTRAMCRTDYDIFERM